MVFVYDGVFEFFFVFVYIGYIIYYVCFLRLKVISKIRIVIERYIGKFYVYVIILKRIIFFLKGIKWISKEFLELFL